MGKVKVKKTKKKIKVSKAVAASLLNVIGKKSRAATGKNSASGSNGRPNETEQYSVVPFDYNIQAQIDWLTAPPSSSQEKKSTHVVPPPSKKPQRGYHKDVCEACGESEYLMYCDKCPSAYHAICDDPPVPFEDYETIGLTWKCKKCRSQGEEGATSAKAIPSGEGVVSKFFQQCLPSIQNLNPVQFKLPKEMPAFDYPFPGTSRHMLKKGRNRTKFVVAEKGTVPRPTSLCYHCNRSCRVGALIQCDKCDLYFHLDCLDPPLTTVPPTVWICPLHVEPYLESTQLTSVALSQRIKIWDDGEKPVNSSEVIETFVRKASRKNPMFRRKKLIPMTLTPEIPEMVQNCYKDNAFEVPQTFGTMQTLVAACEVERLKFEMEETENKQKNNWVDHYLPLGNSLVQQRAKLEYLRSQNQIKLEHLRGVLKTYEELEEQRSKKCPENGETSQTKAVPTVIESVVTEPEGSQPKSDSSPVVQAKVADKSTAPPETTAPLDGEVLPKNELEDEHPSPPPPQNDEEFDKVTNWLLEELKTADAETNEDLKAVNELTQDVRRTGELLLNVPLTDELVNNLASKNLVEDDISAQVANSMTAPLSIEPVPSTSRIESAPSIFPKYVPREPSFGLQIEQIKCLPRKTQLKLAACHIRHLRRKREIKEYKQAEKAVHNINPSTVVPGPRPLISFFVENICLNVEITKRSFWIGSGEDCDWKITDFVKCNRIDSKHAKMFYNPMEQCWEILNYSAQGLYVNNTLFGCKSELAYTAPSTSTLERIHEITEINSKRIDEFIKTHNKDIFTIDPKPCFCKPFPTKGLVNVYEGSAKILTGHKLQIGCAKLSVECMLTSM